MIISLKAHTYKAEFLFILLMASMAGEHEKLIPKKNLGRYSQEDFGYNRYSRITKILYYVLVSWFAIGFCKKA